ncbi:glycosyltransferase family 2 protein [Azospirillum oleiclasticum]|uniref:glycosyltransferase family 2 protein n=1 Tax=Azospirillum oleiclasticum TaxID=2735135 RepID=UPI0015D4C67B|nr:glycosyltransferase family 2 protein [Azospirillum oleiclasticum]
MSAGDWVTMLAMAVLGLALLPLTMTILNLPFYRAPRGRLPAGSAVSVLIPARNEEATIARALDAALANRDVALEVVVLDDHSTDRTADIVRAYAARDPRVRLEGAPPLPPGWSGKQHACQALADLARHDILLFQDADVRLAPDAVGRAAGFLVASGAGLASGFPRQETGTLAEALVVPQIHTLLLGYLPMAGLRFTRHPGFGAACGQFILVRRDAYERAGGHVAIKRSLHDGVTLPRAFRRVGIATRLFDATDLATCRMYRGFAEVWDGFSKNATEGMATPVALPVWTVLLGGGHILPWLLLLAGLVWPLPAEALSAAAAGALATTSLRIGLALRFRQSLAGALLHPAGVATMLAIQWNALLRARRGRPATWRGRAYPSG